MSNEALKAVFARTDLPPYERLVMLALADRCDKGMTCFPSLPDICQRTGMAVRGVQNVLARLEAAGFLTIRRGGGRHQSNEYRLHVPNGNPAHDAGNVEGKPCTPCTDYAQKPRMENTVSGAETPHPMTETPHPVPKTPHPVHPEPSLTLKEPSEEDLTAPAAPEPKARLPDGWVLSDEGWDYARRQNIPDEAINDEAAGFHAYWTDRHDRDAKKSHRGWEQCWAGWCRRIAPRYARHPGRGSPHDALLAGFQRSAMRQ